MISLYWVACSRRKGSETMKPRSDQHVIHFVVLQKRHCQKQPKEIRPFTGDLLKINYLWASLFLFLQARKISYFLEQSDLHTHLTTISRWQAAKRGGQQGRRQRGDQWCPAQPFEIYAPSFHVWLPGCCIHLIQYFKNVAPLSGFWPLLLVFGPPAAKSWRRAWWATGKLPPEIFKNMFNC